MTRYADAARQPLSPTRTLAISIALVLHAAAFALLMAPVRAPDLEADQEPPEIEVVMQERVIPPPPPPPVVPITPPRPAPALVQRTSPPVVIPNPLPAQTQADVVPVIAPPDVDLPTERAGNDAFVPSQIGALSYLDAPPPRYPSRAIARQLEGEVLLRVTVGADGRPEKVELQQTSGHTLLDHAAIEQVQKRWRFRPLIVDGLPSRAIGLVPIRFSLDRR